MPYFSESSKEFQKSYFKCSRKILCKFQLRKVGSHVFVQAAQSCVQTPFSVEKPNSSKLHLSGRFSEFEKIPAFLHRYGVGTQLAPVRTPRQNHLNIEILDKEIACIHSTSVLTTGQHVRMRSCYGNCVQTMCNRLDSRATPSRRSLNKEMREACYGKPVAQKTIQILNASVQTLPREIKDTLDLGLLSL
jgi:hypothetical protein